MGQGYLPKAKDRDVDMRWKDLPKHSRPFEENIGDVERVEYPSPLGRTQAQVILCPGCLCVTDVATVEV